LGNFFSTRWKGHSRAQVVEDSLILHIAAITRNAAQHGEIAWRNATTGTIDATADYNRGVGSDGAPWAVLRYLACDDFQPHPVELHVRFCATRPHFGGVRWWFSCPHCGSRVAKLYLPPGRSRFACRTCHGLTYRLRQEHRTWFGDVRKALQSPPLFTP
jgi:hypothetical protein